MSCKHHTITLEEQNTQLKADLAKITRKGEDLRCVYGNALGEIHDLKADLAKFGGHTAECIAREWHKAECDCGYAEAKERWE